MNGAADWSLRMGAPGGGVVLGLALLLTTAVVALGLWELRRVKVPGRRATLGLLRILTALSALGLALQPEWVERQVERVEGRLAVLLDLSRSMSVRLDERTRMQHALEHLQDQIPAARLKPALYGFGAEARPIQLRELGDGAPLLEDDTRIMGALQAVTSDLGEELGAALVVSDGADLDPAFSAALVAELGIKVHTVAVGDANGLRDDAIAEINVDPVSFLRQDAQVQVTLHSSPPLEQPLVVTLRRGEEVVREVEATPDDKGRAQVVLPFTPRQLGRSVYSVSIPQRDEDQVPENNERAFLVRVVRDRLRVLMVCGSPGWDSRFLRAFLKADPSIDLITFFILRTANDLTMAAPQELSLIPFPTDELFRQHLGSFDVVVFQDFNYAPYQMARYMPRVRDYVLQGGALAMVGGSRSFGGGGYERTPLAQVLPVHLVPGSKAFDPEPFAPQVAADMGRHPLVELAPDPMANRRAWAALSPLQGANLLGAPRQGARALLVHPRSKAADVPMPVLAVGDAGKGRTLALGVDTSWHWGFRSAGSSGDASAYTRFWDRALRWLSRDPALEPNQVETDRERYAPSARLSAELRLRDGDYQPLREEEVVVRVLDLEGNPISSQHAATNGQGRAKVELKAPSEAGGYRLAVGLGDEELADEGFVVEAAGDELADPRARPERLEQIAQASGGRFFESLDQLKDLDQLDRSRARAMGSRVRRPLNGVAFFAFFALCFAAEWFLRRAWGLR